MVQIKFYVLFKAKIYIDVYDVEQIKVSLIENKS